MFTTSKPGGSYSTLYYGQCDSFSRYGDFFAVSETCDTLNKRSDDNAFVLLDSSYSTDQIISVSAQMTDMLTGSAAQVDGSAGLKAYAAKTYMLSTSWNQQDPYNKYCPVDPSTKKRSVAGCTNIAEAQVIYYWIEQGKLDLSLTLESSDAYTENGITIDEKSATATQYGYLSFSETNKLLANFSVGDADSIAALCFVLYYRETVASGFDLLPGDAGDGRLNVVMADSWRDYFSGRLRLGDTRIYHPFRGAQGFSDLNLSLFLMEVPFRLCGMDEARSAQAVCILLFFVGVMGMFHLCHKLFGISFPWSVVCALFAFLNNAFWLKQLHTQFYFLCLVPVLGICVFRYLELWESGSARKRIAYGLGAAARFAAIS